MSNKCRISKKELINIVDFGMHPLGNGFVNLNEINSQYKYKMAVGFCEISKMFQLLNQPDPSIMFHENYAFYSSTSKYMEIHFEELYKEIINSKFFDGKNSLIVELGCNDGIFLKNFQLNKYNHLGIEPSKNVANEASKKNINVIYDFYTSNLANQIITDYGKVNIYYAANVMCHIPNLVDIFKGIKNSIVKHGVLIFEDPYLLDVIKKTSYDQIYDEHVYLFSAHSIEYLVNIFDMEIIDMKHLNTHGGSMRYYVANKGIYEKSNNVDQIFYNEKKYNLDKVETYLTFSDNVKKSKKDLIDLLEKLKKDKKKISGYAATSKSTTILNYCNIDSSLINEIYDTTPEKIGKYSPGMNIPVKSFDEFYKNIPDYSFIFAWNHFKEITLKESNYISNGGKWITHVPKVSIL